MQDNGLYALVFIFFCQLLMQVY